VSLLDACCILRRDGNTEIGEVPQRIAISSGQGNSYHATASGRLERSENVTGAPTGGYPNRSVTRYTQRFDLSGKYLIKFVIIADRGQARGIYRKGQASKSWAVKLKSTGQFRGQVLRVRCAATVSEEKHFMAASQDLDERITGIGQGLLKNRISEQGFHKGGAIVDALGDERGTVICRFH
jgi:hypothetical protein